MSNLNTILWIAKLQAALPPIIRELGAIPTGSGRLTLTHKGREITIIVDGDSEPLAKPPADTKLEPQIPLQRTKCEQDCLRVLQAAGTPMTRPKIKDALEAAGKLWGDSTIAYALADMVSEGTLENSRKRGGYFLAEER